jgi:hypothetical protein
LLSSKTTPLTNSFPITPRYNAITSTMYSMCRNVYFTKSTYKNYISLTQP